MIVGGGLLFLGDAMEMQSPYETGKPNVIRVIRMVRDENWKSKVYKHDEIKYPENWNEIRAEIIKRDRYTCYRCEMKAERMGDLSVHHIIPRAEGGSENQENLITLCHPCHDFVEEHEYRSKSEIIGSYEGEGVNYKPTKSPDIYKQTRTETFERPAWHQSVYGGRKNR